MTGAERKPGHHGKRVLEANISRLDYLLDLAPLQDENGEKYPELPCMFKPHDWDEDAYVSDKRAAADKCLWTCPAVDACWVRLHHLGDAATGVWAGIILPKRPDGHTGGGNGRRRRSNHLPDLPPSPHTIINTFPRGMEP